MRDFDPNRIASEWHSGQGSALYAYASTDRIPTERFKDRLVSEIERAMEHADDEGLDELEYLLMHVEESHPDLYPNDEMHEEVVYEMESPDAAGRNNVKKWVDVEQVDEGDKKCPCGRPGCDCDECNECGGLKSEGTCECSMVEADREPSTYDHDDKEMSLDAKRSAAAEKSRRDAKKSRYDQVDIDEADIGGWLKKAAGKVKDIAMTDVGGPEGVLGKSDRAQKHGKAKGGESDAFRAWKEKRAQRGESVLHATIDKIVREMKLSVAGRSHFDFGGGSEVDPDDVAHFLLTKKDVEEPKSGVKKSKGRDRKPKQKSKKVG